MPFLILLAAAGIVWLLWSIHQDLLEANQRQRDMRMELVRVVERLDAALARSGDTDRANPNSAPAAAPININTAAKAELRTLPQIGAATADRIVAGRPFSSIEDLKQVPGINETLFAKLADSVCVD